MDTPMGMTPLEGLVMGTCCGDLDPAIPFYLRRATQIPKGDLEALLNKASGLKGVCSANDMREILQMANRGEPQAQLALELYCYRIKKYLGAYFAVLGRVDAAVFTCGSGENAAPVRKQCCQGLEAFGVTVDDRKNEKACAEVLEIQKDGAPVKVLAVRTKEERQIAEQTVAALLRTREGEGIDPENFSVDESWLVRESPEAQPASQPLSDKLVTHEKEMIEAALTESRGRVSGATGAAAKLGIPASTLESKIRSLKINKHRFKPA